MSARRPLQTARLLTVSLMYLATTLAVLFLGWIPATMVGFAGFGATAYFATSGSQRGVTPAIAARRGRS